MPKRRLPARQTVSLAVIASGDALGSGAPLTTGVPPKPSICSGIISVGASQAKTVTRPGWTPGSAAERRHTITAARAVRS